MKRIPIMLALLLSPLAGAEVVSIDAQQLKELIARGTPVVDVRTAGEWAQSGVVEGSRTITYFDEQGRSDPGTWMQAFSKIAQPGDDVVIICRSGARSSKVAAYLDQQKGYRRVFTVEGGVIGWKALGNPTVSP